ncbi:MAG: hypothetical protein RR898_04365 [Clostridium sp.]|uniref:hypothetical protein n=1 Tax=Clostridium sp. TaxID=1506 RepID=UPI002FCB3E8E
MYMTNNNNEESEVMEGIFSRPNSISESVKDAILEMNIMRQQRVSSNTLSEMINKYGSEFK